jgi:hypothetical protein
MALRGDDAEAASAQTRCGPLLLWAVSAGVGAESAASLASLLSIAGLTIDGITACGLAERVQLNIAWELSRTRFGTIATNGTAGRIVGGNCSFAVLEGAEALDLRFVREALSTPTVVGAVGVIAAEFGNEHVLASNEWKNGGNCKQTTKSHDLSLLRGKQREHAFHNRRIELRTAFLKRRLKNSHNTTRVQMRPPHLSWILTLESEVAANHPTLPADGWPVAAPAPPSVKAAEPPPAEPKRPVLKERKPLFVPE